MSDKNVRGHNPNDDDESIDERTDDVDLGDTFHIEGVLPTVEVAMIEDGAVVLETVGSDEIREYIIPKAVIENSQIAVPA